MFQEFPKITRLNREVIVTEKLDGTNACVVITDYGEIFAQSRNRLITPEDDNYGFAKWVQENREELLKLGCGHHYGEWWGLGIQRNYGLAEKRFSLFNVSRWRDSAARPACCHVVPTLATLTGFNQVHLVLQELGERGSLAAPGFMNPEGIIAFHTPSHHAYKATLEKDSEWKGKGA